MKHDIQLKDGQQWFGYVSDDPEQMEFIGLGMNCDYNLATYIPYGKLAGAGATIDGISFMLQSPKAKNIKVWASSDLPESDKYSTNADIEVKAVNASSVNLGDYTEVAFSKSHVIPEGGVWLGLSFDIEGMEEAPDDSEISDEDYYGWWYDEVYVPWLTENEADAYPFCVSFLENEVFEGSMRFASDLLDDMDEAAGYEPYGWEDYSDYGYCVAIKGLIGGGKFYTNAGTPDYLGRKVALVNGDVNYTMKLTNGGQNPIGNITYEVVVGGKKVAEETVELDMPLEGLLKSTFVPVSFNAGSTLGEQEFELTVTKVNGQSNESSAKTTYGSVVVLEEVAKKTPLIEEFTGTWCGWCTRGWVALEKLANDFKDDAILMAVHSDDPMAIDAYAYVIEDYVSGFPSMFIDRSTSVDPYYGSLDIPYGVKYDVAAALEEPSPVGIEVKAEWASDDKTKVDITSSATLYYDEEDPALGIGYAIVADEITGKGRSWAQANAYNGSGDDYADDPDLLKLCDMGDYIMNMTYNHVVVAAYGIDYGLEGSIEGPMKAKVPVKHNYTVDLTDTFVGSSTTAAELVSDKTVKVVAILFSQETGEVLNAAETILQLGTGVSGVREASVAQTARYNLAGQQLTAPQKGVNIIRLSNGKTVKVLVK